MSFNKAQGMCRGLSGFSSAALLCSAVTLVFPALAASQTPDFPNDAKARELVRRVVANELTQEGLDKSHYAFKLKRVTPKGSKVQQIVQTDQGSIARTLLVDGQPPNPDQKQAEEQKIQKL